MLTKTNPMHSLTVGIPLTRPLTQNDFAEVVTYKIHVFKMNLIG